MTNSINSNLLFLKDPKKYLTIILANDNSN